MRWASVADRTGWLRRRAPLSYLRTSNCHAETETGKVDSTGYPTGPD